MKKTKYPQPKKKINTEKDFEKHIVDLVYNAMSWLNISGYKFWVLMPKDKGWIDRPDAGMSIAVRYPYKKFFISVQKDTIKSALGTSTDSPLWLDIEHGIFHECLHVIVWHFAEIAQTRAVTMRELEQAEETMVDHLTNIIHKMVNDTRKKSK